jgi:hypothetical protein
MVVVTTIGAFPFATHYGQQLLMAELTGKVDVHLAPKSTGSLQTHLPKAPLRFELTDQTRQAIND